jgi:hypothetical protein
MDLAIAEDTRLTATVMGTEPYGVSVWLETEDTPGGGTPLRSACTCPVGRERIALGEENVDQLVAQARKKLNHVTAQEAWRSKWTGRRGYARLRQAAPPPGAPGRVRARKSPPVNRHVFIERCAGGCGTVCSRGLHAFVRGKSVRIAHP